MRRRYFADVPEADLEYKTYLGFFKIKARISRIAIVAWVSLLSSLANHNTNATEKQGSQSIKKPSISMTPKRPSRILQCLKIRHPKRITLILINPRR